MPELDDIALLGQFARDNSEEAFATLAGRHINLVYSVALRKTSNPHAAEEITQAVFLILARKAKSFSPKSVLSGWLHQTARLTAANYLRAEIRRQKREQEAYMQSLLNEPEPDAWAQIAPFLDDALSKLGEQDRDAIVLRFFENKNLREVGVALGASEDAAKMRVNRALEKLRKLFSKRGVALTTAIIAGTVSAHSVQAAPAGLATTVVAASAKGSAIAASTLTLVKGVLKFMAWTKAKSVIVVAAAAIFAISTATVTVVKVRAAALEVYFSDFQSQDLESAPSALILRPTKYQGQGDYIAVGHDTGPDGKVMRRGCSISEVLATAYAVGPSQIILPRNVPKGEFDFLVTLDDHRREALQAAIKKQFGLVAHLESRDTDVMVLKSVSATTPGLKVSEGPGPIIEIDGGSLNLKGYKMSDPASADDVARTLGQYIFYKPVIDETGLTNSYDVDLTWDAKLTGRAAQAAVVKAMRDELGLEALPDRRSVEMLVVEKAK